MFHTGELGKYIGWYEFIRIKRNCPQSRRKDGTLSPNHWFFDKYQDAGLIFNYYEPTEEQKAQGHKFPWMQVIVNFAKMLKAAEHIELPNHENVKDLPTIFEALMETACLEQRELPYPFHEDAENINERVNTTALYVQRLDCTMQVSGLLQEIINSYIRIYNHSNRKIYNRIHPNGRAYDKYGNYPRERKDSAYFASKSIGVNIYDKRQQMLNRNKDLIAEGKNPKYSKSDLLAAAGVLRVEFQCHKAALNYRLRAMKPKEERARVLENLLDVKISESIIFSNLERLAWHEPHVNLLTARKVIQASKLHKKSKESLQELLRLASVKGRQIHEVIDHLPELKELDEKKRVDVFNSKLRQIRHCGINPILLSTKEPFDSLENLQVVLRKQCEESKSKLLDETENEPEILNPLEVYSAEELLDDSAIEA